MTQGPTILDNVERVAAIERSAFIDGYVKHRKPVIIRDSQNAAPISRVVSEQDALDVFGDVVIQVQQNYTSPLSRVGADVKSQGLSQKVRNQIDEMDLRNYCDHVRKDPATDLLCVEYRTPDTVLQAMAVPEYCDVPWSTEALVTFMFVANQGNYAHMHFDGDYRSVLLYQIFGRKRVVMVPVEAGAKLSPAMNFSKLLLQNIEDDEKLHLLRYLGAYDCLLEPGEMVYFPPSIWHYVEYVDTGMSVNFRFGRGDFARKVIDANRVPFYPDLHLMLDRLSRVEAVAEGHQLESRIWGEVTSVLGQEYATSQERHQAVQALYRSLAASMPGEQTLAPQMDADCLIAEAMAVERHDSPSKRWRDELMLGQPI